VTANEHLGGGLDSDSCKLVVEQRVQILSHYSSRNQPSGGGGSPCNTMDSPCHRIQMLLKPVLRKHRPNFAAQSARVSLASSWGTSQRRLRIEVPRDEDRPEEMSTDLLSLQGNPRSGRVSGWTVRNTTHRAFHSTTTNPPPPPTEKKRRENLLSTRLQQQSSCGVFPSEDSVRLGGDVHSAITLSEGVNKHALPPPRVIQVSLEET